MTDSQSDKRVRRKLTPKQRVLQIWPHAVCYRDKYGHFQITEARLLGGGKKEKEAWADAARRL